MECNKQNGSLILRVQSQKGDKYNSIWILYNYYVIKLRYYIISSLLLHYYKVHQHFYRPTTNIRADKMLS